MLRLGTIFVMLAVLVRTPVSSAQQLLPPQPNLGSTLTADILQDLPVTDLLSALETTQAEVISERVSSGGLNAGRAPRIGAFLGSPSQTQYRIGDVSVSDPNGTG